MSIHGADRHSDPPAISRWPRDRGYWTLACAVAASLLVAEYMGPVIAIGFGIVAISAGALCVHGRGVPPVPVVGYWLVAIFVVGLASSVYANTTGNSVEGINLQRDIGIIVSYLLFLIGGYLFAYDRSTFRLGLVILVLVGLIVSVVHLIQFGIVVSGNVSSLYLLRLSAGRGSVTEYAALFAGVILLADPVMERYKSHLRFGIGFLALSILLTLSRGLILDILMFGLILAALAVRGSGPLRLDAFNLIRTVGIVILSVAATYLIVKWTLPVAFNFVKDQFVTKLVNSFTEVSGTNLETRNQIADNYRAFELKHVISLFTDSSTFVQWVGQGWGSTLRFGFETASTKSNFSRTEAPFLHNGYAYYVMKTGIIGVVLYVCFLLHLAIRAVCPRTWKGDPLVRQRKVLLALALAIAADTVASGGLGFPASHLGAVFLVGMCCGPVWGTGGVRSDAPPSLTSSPSGRLSRLHTSTVDERRLGERSC